MLAESLKLIACKGVYEPREDSYMLARAVEEHAFGKVLDLGTGSGMQGIVAALKGCDVSFSDVDPRAVECARINAVSNHVGGKFLTSDMFGEIKGRFDTIIFNPPYVASESRRHLALDGGRRGRELIDRFLAEYAGHIKKRHAVLLVESSFNGYEKDAKRLGAKVVGREHYFFEDIVVLLF